MPALAEVQQAIIEQAAAEGRTAFSTESLWDQSDWSVLKTLGRIITQANKGFPKGQGPIQGGTSRSTIFGELSARGAQRRAWP